MRIRASAFVFSVVCLTAQFGCGGGTSSAPPPAAVPVLQTITVTPTDYSLQVGLSLLFAATGSYNDGSKKDLTKTVVWSSSDEAVATADNSGNVTAIAIGKTTIQATSGSVSGSTTLTVTPLGLLKNAGLWTQFERRGAPSEYWSGEVIQNWTQFDSLVGSTVSQEVSLQLDKMKAIGVNTITFQLRTADPTYTGQFTPPDCNEPPVLGLQFPQPTATELANLPLFFDMVESKGMKVWLSLLDTHMEQQPPTNSQTWLGAIFGAIGRHPALDLVSFDGTPYTRQTTSGVVCGIPAEPPLWDGPTSIAGTYVQWAINFAMSQGLPARKLSAEAIVGSYFFENQPPASPLEGATDNHFWSPIAVEKTIFDNLGIPANQRTYELSFYEHRKCSGFIDSLPCTDLDPHDWADQTLQYVTSVVGSGPRIVALEMGDLPPVDQVNWNTQHSVESLVFLLHKYGLDGGSFWRWVSFNTSEDSDPTLADPVKRRGAPFVYNPVEKEVIDMGGFHLASVPNGSFEGAVVNGVPESWRAAGNGTVSQYLLTQEPAEPEVPSRGSYAMRLVTGTGLSDTVTATSVMIPVIPATKYTTTANMRFGWSGDPNPTGLPASRPQVFVSFFYFQANGTPSAIQPLDSFSFFQEDSTMGFDTFPLQYTTPTDAAFVGIQFGAARNGLPTQITFDVDNVR